MAAAKNSPPHVKMTEHGGLTCINDAIRESATSALQVRMVDDAVLVALIGHSVMAETDAEKLAARLLLDTLRNGNNLDCLHAQVEAIGPERGFKVAEELAVYIDRYRLDADPT